MSRMTGKTAVIVGASRGIGKGVALAFASEGAHVIAVARREGDNRFPGSVQQTVDEIQHSGGDASAAFCDIADAKAVAAMVEQILAQTGTIDILVNSAVQIVYDRFLDITEAVWDRAFEVNVKGAFLLTQAVAPSMIARRSGHIIHLTGSGAREIGVVTVATGASKAALERFVVGVAEEFRVHNVAVNLFDPGGVKTERAVVLQGADRDWSGFATPAEVARAAVHLALQSAQTITGSLFRYQDYRKMK